MTRRPRRTAARALPRTLRRLARAWMRAYAHDAEFWRYGPALGPTPPVFPIPHAGRPAPGEAPPR